MVSILEKSSFDVNELQQIHKLLDLCYSKPPKDVFYRFVEQYGGSVKCYLAIQGECVAGLVQLVPNSKGGTLETLAVHPDFQGMDVAKALVNKLLSCNSGVIQLTTRIPDFFEKFGFQKMFQLDDKSIFMVHYPLKVSIL